MGEYAELDPQDVLDELLDMARPAADGRVTRADLRACGLAGTLFSVLSSVEQFYQYNYRESFMQAGEAGGGAGGNCDAASTAGP